MAVQESASASGRPTTLASTVELDGGDETTSLIRNHVQTTVPTAGVDYDPGNGARSGIRPPGSWRRPESHFLDVLDSEWYRVVVELQSAISVLTTLFWSTQGLANLLLPLTTHSISSPMGLGSDSLPVEVEIAGLRTHLADSMQFMLEYGCRLAPKGCYYLMPSFRGEDSDASHLSQFFHSEAEIIGGLEDVMSLVERYVAFHS